MAKWSTMKETELAFLTGLFEGEGCASLCWVRPKGEKPYKQPRLDVAMTDIEPLQALQATFGGSITLRKRQQAHWKPIYRWGLQCLKAATVAMRLFPYMKSRRRKQALLDILSHYLSMPDDKFKGALKRSDTHWRNKACHE